jgi:hypothetical protein
MPEKLRREQVRLDFYLLKDFCLQYNKSFTQSEFLEFLCSINKLIADYQRLIRSGSLGACCLLGYVHFWLSPL